MWHKLVFGVNTGIISRKNGAGSSWAVLDYKGDNIRLKYVSEMLDIVEEKGKGKQDAFKEKIRLYVGVSLYIYSKLNRWFMKCKLYRS